MAAARRHLSAVSATHLLAFGLILVWGAFTGLAPLASADTPPGTSTDQVTVSDPTTDVTPLPDPAPPKNTSPPTPKRTVPVSKGAAPSHVGTSPLRSSGSAARTEPTRTVVQPSFVPVVPAPATRPAVATTPHPIRKAVAPKAQAKHHPASSPALERPPQSPAVQQPATVGSPSPSVVVSRTTQPHSSSQHKASQAGTSTMARDFVVILDAVAVLLLATALIPRAVLQRRVFVNRAARLRPSLAAAGISLLSASLILFILNLSGPVP